MHRSSLLGGDLLASIHLSIPGSAGGRDVTLIWAMKSFTPVQTRYQVLAKPAVADWLWEAASTSNRHQRQ